MTLNFDVIVVGSGLAGLSVALHLADAGAARRIALVAKGALDECASAQAQGGIAAALDPADSVPSHVRDTLVAGAGLCDENATRNIVEHGRAAIEWLIAQHVSFTRDAAAECGFHLTREGGHSHRRIIHAADATGRAVINTLVARARRHPDITVLENHLAIDVISDVISEEITGRITNGTNGEKNGEKNGAIAPAPDDPRKRRCRGLYALDLTDTAKRVTLVAPHTVLATGGAGKVYLHTTNPDTATGDGIAMAWRAGCRISNMEFIQFHPTSLFHPRAKSFLISEAVRGEGGLLKLPDGTRFMPAHDARAELAPRDVVARAIDFEIKKHGLDCVYLDISHQPAVFIETHFPTILAHCRAFGIDMTKAPIPVVPAAHYTCGGVLTDLTGRTDLAGLYAVGETACTGLHGANRLASNSLLECLVTGQQAAQAIGQEGFDVASFHTPLPGLDASRISKAGGEAGDAREDERARDELRRLMWDDVGIVRSDERLARAQRRVALLRAEIGERHANFRATRDWLELRNLADVASLIIASARARHESRGLHYNRDWPDTLPIARPSVLMPLGCGGGNDAS